MRIPEDKKPVRVTPKERGQLLTYEELGLTPIHDFDYENYDKVHLYINSGLVPVLWNQVFKQFHERPMGFKDTMYCALYLLEHNQSIGAGRVQRKAKAADKPRQRAVAEIHKQLRKQAPRNVQIGDNRELREEKHQAGSVMC